MSFVELSALSNFTFLTGASHPEEYMERAARIGLAGLVIADENSVAGIVRAHVQAREIARRVAERRASETALGLIGPLAPPGHHPVPGIDIYNIPRLIPGAARRWIPGGIIARRG